MKHPTTNPVAFILHSLVSLFVGALGAGGAFAIQQIGSGAFSLPVLLTGAFTAFLAYFGAGFVMLEKNPEAKAALLQTGQAVIERVDQLQQSHSGLATQVGQLIGHVRQLALLLNQTPPTAIGQGAPNPTPQQLTQPPAGWQTTNAPVPQQPFPGQSLAPNAPAQPLNWTGLTQAVNP